MYVLCTCFNKRKESSEWKAGYLLRLRISIYKINKDGSFDIDEDDNNIGHVDILWKRDDLSTSKFTIKLLEELIRLVYKNKLFMGSIDGFPLSYVIRKLNYKKYKLD